MSSNFKEDKLLVLVLVALETFIVVPLKALLAAWGCTKIWQWFIEPSHVLSIESPSYGFWVGIAFIAGLLTLKIPKHDKDESFVEVFGRSLAFFPVVIILLLSGYLCHRVWM